MSSKEEGKMLTEKEKRFIKSQRKSGRLLLILVIIFLTIGILSYPKLLDIGFNRADQIQQSSIEPDIQRVLVNELFRSRLSGFFTGIFVGLLLGIYFWNRKWLKIVDKLDPPQSKRAV